MSCSDDILENIIRQVLQYDCVTGQFHWQSSPLMSGFWNKRYAGKQALTATNSEGYKVGKVMGRYIRAHRAAWLLHYGEWPESQIDHIDGVRHNNAISNLRSVTNAENCKNRAKSNRNKSGFVGVRSHGDDQWIAEIGLDGKTSHIGVYSNLDDAIAAREAAAQAFGYSLRHGQ